MFDIYVYHDRNGKEPVIDYLDKLASQNTKDSRIRLNKIRSYIKLLSDNGFLLPDVICKHLEGDVWELRPSKDRVLFVGWENGLFVLLHCFEKKTQKTPKREIEKAKQEFEIFKEIWKEETKCPESTGLENGTKN